MRSAIILTTAVLLSAPARAQELGCEDHPAQDRACYWVRGSFNLTGDSGLGIWPADGGRALMVRNRPNGRDAPPELTRHFDANLQTIVEGRFRVCPVPPDMPIDRKAVCVEAAQVSRVARP